MVYTTMKKCSSLEREYRWYLSCVSLRGKGAIMAL